MENRMCNLIEHTERDHRTQQARRREPIYAELADQHGIEYQPPTTDNQKTTTGR